MHSEISTEFKPQEREREWERENMQGKVCKMLFTVLFFVSKRYSSFRRLLYWTLYVGRSSCSIFSIWLFFPLLLILSLCHTSLPLMRSLAKKPLLLFSHQLNSFILSRHSTCDLIRRIFTPHSRNCLSELNFGAFRNFAGILFCVKWHRL